MLVIVCGDDTAASRRYFLELQDRYKKQGFYIAPLSSSLLADTLKEDLGTVTLFNEKKVYAIENITRSLNRTSTILRTQLKDVAQNNKLTILDWESHKTAREISLKEAQITEFKLPASIFKLLDLCYPGSLAQFIQLFRQVSQSVEPEFVFAMLSKHVRQLILASQNSLPSSVPSWQRAKLYEQSAKWQESAIIAFYESLGRLDQNVKSGKDTLGVQQSLDIIACFYLR